MTSCAIIVSHYKSLKFLEATIRQIRKHVHPEIETHTYIIDQSGEAEYNQIKEWYWCSADITIVKTDSRYSGYGIDFLLRYYKINQEYIAQIHSDSFPIHGNWLYLPIKLIEENNLSFVGQLQFISKETDTIYPPNPFFAMAQCFNVARTETYKEMSMEAGFTRYHQRATLDMEFNNDDWAQWAKDDYINRGSDDDIVAFHWESKYRNTDKLGLAISGFIEPSYGRIIDDLVFHFGSCREAVGVMDKMPEKYKYYTEKINVDYSDELIYEMVELAKLHRHPTMEILSRNHWDGTLKKSFPPSDELNKRIEELKHE